MLTTGPGNAAGRMSAVTLSVAVAPALRAPDRFAVTTPPDAEQVPLAGGCHEQDAKARPPGSGSVTVTARAAPAVEPVDVFEIATSYEVVEPATSVAAPFDLVTASAGVGGCARYDGPLLTPSWISWLWSLMHDTIAHQPVAGALTRSPTRVVPAEPFQRALADTVPATPPLAPLATTGVPGG